MVHRWPRTSAKRAGCGLTLLDGYMNTDNQGSRLIDPPKVAVCQRADGQYEVEVQDFSYFDTVQGEPVLDGKGGVAVCYLFGYRPLRAQQLCAK